MNPKCRLVIITRTIALSNEAGRALPPPQINSPGNPLETRFLPGCRPPNVQSVTLYAYHQSLVGSPLSDIMVGEVSG